MLKNTRESDTSDNAGLGARLRKLRKTRRMTLQAVADKAGLTTGFISQVERDIAAPSLSSLMSIAEALDAHVTDFLKSPRNDRETTHGSHRERYAVPGGTNQYERLSTRFPGSQLSAVLLHEPPGHRSEAISHRGEELYFVLAGEITVSVDGTQSVLREGDSIHFDSNRTHFTWNHSDRPATFIVCNTMDVFGDDDGGRSQAHDSDTNRQGEDEK